MRWTEILSALTGNPSSGRFFSVQFHPEASSGPTDTEFLFDKFIKML